MTDTFKRNLTISAIGHLAILLLVFVRAAFVPSEPIEIRRAIRVDVVDLPPKVVDEPLNPPAPKVEAPSPPQEAPKPPPKPEVPVKISKPEVKLKPKDTAKTQSAAIAKLKALSALEKIKQDVSNQKKASNAPAKPSTIVKGNQVSAGNALTGLDKIEYDKYFDEMESKIRAQWSIPQWLADGNYRAQVQILIDERGYVTKKIMRRSSGNETFDAQVMAAIDGSSPLPAPPGRLKGMLAASGVILNFPE